MQIVKQTQNVMLNSTFLETTNLNGKQIAERQSLSFVVNNILELFIRITILYSFTSCIKCTKKRERYFLRQQIPVPNVLNSQDAPIQSMITWP